MDREREITEFREMDREQQRQELLDKFSDIVRMFADKIAYTKAMTLSTAKQEEITAEDFDAAFMKEYEKAWKKYEGKSKLEIAIMGLGMILSESGKLDVFDELKEK